MMNTGRATAGTKRRIGFTGEFPYSKSSGAVCQDGSKTCVDLQRKRPLSLACIVPSLGVFTVARPGTFEMSTGAMIVAGIVFVVFLAIILRRGRTNAWLAEQNDGLQTLLRKAERHARESEASLNQEIEKLNHQITNLLEVPSQDALRNAGLKVRLLVRPDGREVFLPLLDPRRVYRITVHGTCEFSESTGWFSSREASADALYETDKIGNFTVSHDRLKFDGVPIRRFIKSAPPEAAPEEDRQAHHYAFRVDGAARKISVSFSLLSERTKQPLVLTLEVLPEGAASPKAARSKEEATRENYEEIERVTRKAAAQAQKDLKRTSALHAKLETLRLRAQCESHLLDPSFQREFAARDSAEILLRQRSSWRKEYSAFMQDLELKKLVNEQAPEILQWLEARIKLVQLAERLRIASLPGCEVKEPQKPLTAEEIRGAKLQKRADEHDDRIALAKLRGEKAVEADAVLESLPLDGDLKERLKTELTDSILDNESGNGTGENNVTY